MPVLRWWRWRLSYSLLQAAVLQLLVVLRRPEPKTGGGRSSSTFPIKPISSSSDLGVPVLDLHLSGHRGGGYWEEISDKLVVGGSAGEIPRAVFIHAKHAVTKIVTVILGQQGGPSTTSMEEALSVSCWSSTLRGSQVVRPRLSGGSQGLDLVAGNECSSILRSDLGGDAWRSPTVGGSGFPGPDRFFYLLMSHPWMYGNRCAPAFREGVNSFLLVAEANKSKQGFMCCPCLKCKNEKDYSCSRDIKSHLLRFGFMSSYNVWTKHGEEGVMMEDGDEEEDNDDQYRSMFSECFDTAMDDNEEEGGEEQASDDPVDDDLRRAISDARRDCGTDKERLQFDKMLEDHHKLLYPGCEDGHRKLGSILELLKWKAEVGVTDSGFEKLMIILKKLFLRNNELPVSTYEAKKLVCPLGLDVQKIHACINDCILYRGEKYENLNKCPICGALRYNIRKDNPGDVEGEPPRKRFLRR
ncbi:hypothetical protein QYE76_061154 [Lolium multiflorum]|uniref:Transposase-associated domain-containing protein n=1 Tax=Lolium multiflorum TaxID=4521 RepID=A0AAD8S0F4_LOLMU|nr:hypothetical protein QYE76_061154 [Lolium multiflorum]